MRQIVIACSIAIGISLLAYPAVGQQKTVKACQEEWRANKEANQAKGITEKAYVDQCRAGSTSAQPAAPASTSAPPASSKAPAKETKTAAPPPAPASPPAAAPAAPSKAPAAAKETKTVAPPPAPAPTASAPTGANQFSTEAQAKTRCGAGTVVWANLDSKIYHFAGNKTYGNTKSGAYMCEGDATSQGMRAAKNEKHP